MTHSDFPAINRITTSASPHFLAFYNHFPVKVTCDSGAESSLISHAFALKINMPIYPTKHTANLADGHTPLQAMGEVHASLSHGSLQLKFEALVVRKLDCDILAGVPFMEQNKIVLNIPQQSIIINNKSVISYAKTNTQTASSTTNTIDSKSFLLRSTIRHIIMPGDYLEVNTPEGIDDNTSLAIEPRSDSQLENWPQPAITDSVAGKLRIPNDTEEPIIIRKHQHLAQIHYTLPIDDLPPVNNDRLETTTLHQPSPNAHSLTILTDPDNQLTSSERAIFKSLHKKYDCVFDPKIGVYNDHSGKVRASY